MVIWWWFNGDLASGDLTVCKLEYDPFSSLIYLLEMVMDFPVRYVSLPQGKCFIFIGPRQTTEFSLVILPATCSGSVLQKLPTPLQ